MSVYVSKRNENENDAQKWRTIGWWKQSIPSRAWKHRKPLINRDWSLYIVNGS
jgi:hypothetical protein